MLNIFTFATDKTKLSYLSKSSELFDIKINCILADKWNGYTDKINYMSETLKMLSDSDLVCFIDAYDVLVNNTGASIIQKFNEYKCDILIGAELNCYPDKYRQDMDKISDATTMYKYANSGGYIGYKHAIQKLLSWDLKNITEICKSGGDQTYFMEYYLKNHSDKIKLDSKCEIFQNMHWVSWKDIEFKNGMIHNKILDKYPCFIHFNGGSFQDKNKKDIMPIFIEKMKMSKTLNLDEYEQLTTETCYPHSQINLSIPEKSPVNKGIPIYEISISDIKNIPDTIISQPIKNEALSLLEARYNFGVRKYGQPLMSEDGRDDIEDCLQELGDTIQYLTKAKYNKLDTTKIKNMIQVVNALI